MVRPEAAGARNHTRGGSAPPVPSSCPKRSMTADARPPTPPELTTHTRARRRIGRYTASHTFDASKAPKPSITTASTDRDVINWVLSWTSGFTANCFRIASSAWA